MKFADLIKSGQLAKEETSKHKIAEFLQFADEEIAAAKFNLSKFPLTAYKSAYDGLIHAGNALIRYYGYRPTRKYTHTTITEFVDRILGKDFGHLARSFKRMRRKRHPLQYDAKFTESKGEVKKSIIQAERLVKRIIEHTGIQPLRGRLF
ncbi:MAG: HEPN domain-containing protein [Candidatus Omnitrophica bacterium]|nr:HEPN domain-containing protein [Candidatus Omnitrophota bacterium]